MVPISKSSFALWLKNLEGGEHGYCDYIALVSTVEGDGDDDDDGYDYAPAAWVLIRDLKLQPWRLVGSGRKGVVGLNLLKDVGIWRDNRGIYDWVVGKDWQKKIRIRVTYVLIHPLEL